MILASIAFAYRTSNFCDSGSGIAGLTFAIALAQASDDIHIEMYEAAHELTEMGAGVGMWRRPWQVMETLGLREDLRHLVLSPLDDRPRKCA